MGRCQQLCGYPISKSPQIFRWKIRGVDQGVCMRRDSMLRRTGRWLCSSSPCPSSPFDFSPQLHNTPSLVTAATTSMCLLPADNMILSSWNTSRPPTLACSSWRAAVPAPSCPGCLCRRPHTSPSFFLLGVLSLHYPWREITPDEKEPGTPTWSQLELSSFLKMHMRAFLRIFILLHVLPPPTCTFQQISRESVLASLLSTIYASLPAFTAPLLNPRAHLHRLVLRGGGGEVDCRADTVELSYLLPKKKLRILEVLCVCKRDSEFVCVLWHACYICAHACIRLYAQCMSFHAYLRTTIRACTYTIPYINVFTFMRALMHIFIGVQRPPSRHFPLKCCSFKKFWPCFKVQYTLCFSCTTSCARDLFPFLGVSSCRIFFPLPFFSSSPSTLNPKPGTLNPKPWTHSPTNSHAHCQT